MKEYFPPDTHYQWIHWASSFGWRIQSSSYKECSKANVNDSQKYVFTFSPYRSQEAKHRIDNDAKGISGYVSARSIYIINSLKKSLKFAYKI